LDGKSRYRTNAFAQIDISGKCVYQAQAAIIGRKTARGLIPDGFPKSTRRRLRVAEIDFHIGCNPGDFLYLTTGFFQVTGLVQLNGDFLHIVRCEPRAVAPLLLLSLSILSGRPRFAL
jgi:hypothetical protein